MNLKPIRNLDKKQILAAVGLQLVPSVLSATLKTIGLLGAGLVTGAAFALLVSPKTGREMRRSLRRTLRSGIDEVLDVIPDKITVPLPRGA